MGLTIHNSNKDFQKLYTTDKIYIVLTGGRASRKTYEVHEFIARLTYEKGHGVLFTRYTMVTAEKSIIPEFKGTLQRLGVESDFHITKTHIINKRTKSFIFFTGIKTSSGDQTGNLKSLPGITTWVIEEAEDYKDAQGFRDIDDSIRKDGIQNRVIWVQNPSYADESFFYQRFFKGHEVYNTVTYKGREYEYVTTSHPDVENIHTTYLCNRENINKRKLDQWDQIAIDDPELFQHKYIGGWLMNKEGAVWQKKQLKRFSLKDFNYNNIEAVIAFNDPADRGTDSVSMPIGCLIKDRIYITEWYFSTDIMEVTIPEISFLQKKHNIGKIAVETNGVGGRYAESLGNSIGCTLIPVSASGNKHQKIISNAGFIRLYFVFRDDYEPNSMYDKAMRELFAYNKDEKINRKETMYNDDAPDSITSLWLLYSDLHHSRFH